MPVSSASSASCLSGLAVSRAMIFTVMVFPLSGESRRADHNQSPEAAQATLTHYDDNAFGPRVGLVVQPEPWLSFYGNFTQSLGVNNGQTAAEEVA
jgi:outer membrane receptor protein involved in Fe transport